MERLMCRDTTQLPAEELSQRPVFPLSSYFTSQSCTYVSQRCPFDYLQKIPGYYLKLSKDLTIKVKFTVEQAMKSQRGSTDIALLFL